MRTAYQNLAGLPVTGIVDFDTWQSIASLYDDLVKGSVVNEGQYPGGNVGGQ